MTATLAANPVHAPATPREVCLCTHCRLPVPPGLVQDGAEQQFCCHGCETAYGVISSCGLSAYYQLLERSEGERRPSKSDRRAYAEYDDPTFRAMHCRSVEGGLLRTELLLENVHCAACVWLVEKLPQVVPGVLEARLDMRRATVHVVLDPAAVALSRVAKTLASIGYPPHPARGASARQARRTEDRKMLVRVAVAGACAGNIMLLYFALYAGMFQDIESGFEQLFRYSSMVLNTICLAWPGMVFARSAWGAVRTRTIHLDVPIAFGLYLGGLWGIYKTIASSGDIYFDSISALVFFLLVGRYVQQRQQRYAGDAIELLFSLTPSVARRVEPSGEVVDVPTEALRIGDTVEVRAGDSAPADGVVVRGTSSVDLSLLTGESRPERVGVGSTLAAGTVNLSDAVRLRVEATGDGTRVGQLMRMVETATRAKAPIVRLADKWGGWLLWSLLSLAALTLVIWWPIVGASVAIDRAAALLIATCPCGLGLATPLIMTVAVGRAARRGILVKGTGALQALAERSKAPGTILLDKTGTVTLGRLAVVSWNGDQAVMPMVAALEAHSSHPAAAALLQACGGADSRLKAVDVRQVSGSGIEGVVSGRRVVVGSEAMLRDAGMSIETECNAVAEDVIRSGASPVFIAVDGSCVAVAGLGDPVRPDAAGSIRRLRALGWRVEILSGDHDELVKRVGGELGLPPEACRGGATPETKLQAVSELAAQGTVVMVGDGVNDAAALAAATVGVAVRGGTEASLAAADISLSREGLTPIVDLIEGARRTLTTIHLTIGSSLAYNVVAAGLSVAGLISPLLAAIIMPASSLTAVAICLRSNAFRAKPGEARP